MERNIIAEADEILSPNSKKSGEESSNYYYTEEQLWARTTMENFCLLIPVQVQLSRTLLQLKQDVFVQAKKLPLYNRLRDISNYIFSTIGVDGVHVELYDEQKLISKKEMAQNISTAMGVSLTEIEKNATEESQLFRLKLFEACRDAAEERAATSSADLGSEAREIHEEDLDYILNKDDPEDSEARATEKLKRKIQFSDAYLEVWFRESKTKDNEECMHCIKIRDVLEKTPSDILSLVIRELRTQKGIKIEQQPTDFILQIAGKTVFVIKDVFMTQFEYIRSCFENYRIPKLIIRNKAEVFEDYPEPPTIFEPAYVRKEKHNQIRIHSASQISMLDISEKIFVRVAVAVGVHVLDVKDLAAVSPNNPRWQDGLLEFDIYLKDLPECAQVSFSLISIRKRKSKVHMVPVGWMNLRLFDWRHQLIQGKKSIYLWAFPRDFQDTSLVNLAGTHGSNLNENLASRLELEFPEYEEVVKYPEPATIEKFINIVQERVSRADKSRINDTAKLLPGNPDLDRILLLRRCLDPAKLTKDDQQFIWSMRHKIKELFPQMLVVLADCALIWKGRDTIYEFYGLIRDWPALRVDTAIELLDGRYVDGALRALAVEHLDEALNDDQLQLYLLVLIQAVRFEPYADSPLAIMLIKRSLMNFKVGHTIFGCFELSWLIFLWIQKCRFHNCM
uniref:Uncharacterized protein n=1 Tax=Ditylenchus dipsaci TaxID=166011 RepID=A0A915DFE0_9BILA